jgi:hypothetical protein
MAGTCPAMTKEAFVIARSEATKQSMMSHPGYELLRAACHRAHSRDPLARNDGFNRHQHQSGFT